MASCGQLPSGSLTVRVKESASGQNLSSLEPSDQTQQTPGTGPTVDSRGLEVKAAVEHRNEFTRRKECIIISVTHRALLHHWYVLSELAGSQAQFEKKSVIFSFYLKGEFSSKGTSQFLLFLSFTYQVLSHLNHIS